MVGRGDTGEQRTMGSIKEINSTGLKVSGLWSCLLGKVLVPLWLKERAAFRIKDKFY